ncbi:MAG: efflux RND transporter permease subunit, partial [Moraxellaceae bacterium]
VWITKGDNNIFTQVSLFVLAGLASKNAILIVEFARELEQRGMATFQAAITSSRMRLRPILMTSFAFIMGVLPMVFSTGAGSEMRSVMGIAVFSGMLGVTFFGLFFTPMFYVLLRKLEGKRSYKKDHKTLDVIVEHLVGQDVVEKKYYESLMSPKDLKEMHQ